MISLESFWSQVFEWFSATLDACIDVWIPRLPELMFLHLFGLAVFICLTSKTGRAVLSVFCVIALEMIFMIIALPLGLISLFLPAGFCADDRSLCGSREGELPCDDFTEDNKNSVEGWEAATREELTRKSPGVLQALLDSRNPASDNLEEIEASLKDPALSESERQELVELRAQLRHAAAGVVRRPERQYHVQVVQRAQEALSTLESD